MNKKNERRREVKEKKLSSRHFSSSSSLLVLLLKSCQNFKRKLKKKKHTTWEKENVGGGGRGKNNKDASSSFKKPVRDEELLSEEDEFDNGAPDIPSSPDEGEDAAELETADEKRLRLAKSYLDRTRQSVADAEEDEEEDQDVEQRRGARDSMVADLLQQEQLEESGRIQRKLAARVLAPATLQEGRPVGRKHRQAVTAVCISEDDSTGFAASKDGLLVQWNIETGLSEKYEWPSSQQEPSKTNGSKKKQQGSRHILAVATSSDGRYLASGGLDRSVHIWDTRTRQHLQAFAGHRGAVTSLGFRKGTQQLFSGSLDRTIKLWSVDTRSYIDTLYGHQSEIVSLDCLRQERVLSAGRDRTLRLWKIPEESQLVFRGHAAHMESCCFISNGEFLSGSDDGCVALWNTIRKKPVSIMRNAHGSSSGVQHQTTENANGLAAAAAAGAAESWVGAVAVCSSSDLAASGAGDGTVQLWALEDANRSLRALHGLAVKGFVNSLAFANSGRFLLVGTGQEPRMGRWARNPDSENRVFLHPISLR
ncbi:unnamed protein product [Sphagnum compactum]